MKTLKQILNGVTLNSFFHRKFDNPDNASQLWVTEGHIKVNIQGTSRDEIAVNETFIADKFVGNDVSYSNSFWIDYQDRGKLSFNLKRSIGKEIPTWIFINFCLDGNSISEEHIQIEIFRTLNKNKVLDLALYLEDSFDYPNPNPITNVKFDIKNQIISGKFEFEDNRLSAINISGDFRMKLMQRVM